METHLFESGEDYLERILMLQLKIGEVRSIDIANSMGFSKPSVSVAMKKLKSLNYITINSDGLISLTPEGDKIAHHIFERHTVITKFLMGLLNVSKENALADACKMEHDLSYETFDKMKKFCKEKKYI